MRKGANVNMLHATYVDPWDGNMVHIHTMLTPKTRENNKIHITISHSM